MSESDDEEFLIIFQNNNLEEVMSESERKIRLRVQDIHEGLTDLCGITAFLSNFLTDFFAAYEDGNIEGAPKFTPNATIQLIELFEKASSFIDLVDVESDDEEEGNNGY